MPQAYGSFGGLQAVTDHPVMWVGLGLLKEKEACGPDVAAAKRRRLLSQVQLAACPEMQGLFGCSYECPQTVMTFAGSVVWCCSIACM